MIEFELDIPSLTEDSLQVNNSFYWCHGVVFDSLNDWLIDEWDLVRLQSITLGTWALDGDEYSVESNELIMKSMNDNDIDWWDLPSLSSFKGDHSFSRIGKVILDSNAWVWLWIRYSITYWWRNTDERKIHIWGSERIA